MSAVGMRSPSLTTNRKRAVRTIGPAALLSLMALMIHPGASQATVRKAHKRPAPAHSAHNKHRPHPKQAHTKHRPQHAAKRQAPRRVAKRAPDPNQALLPVADTSPILSSAATLLGRPYRFGSEGGAFDCSGFVRTVFAHVGVELPHSAREQFTLGDRVGRDNLEPGDLVFFRTYRHYATHVGIYVGDDMFVHAATRGGQVQVDSLSEAYYVHHYIGARRIEI